MKAAGKPDAAQVQAWATPGGVDTAYLLEEDFSPDVGWRSFRYIPRTLAAVAVIGRLLGRLAQSGIPGCRSYSPRKV